MNASNRNRLAITVAAALLSPAAAESAGAARPAGHPDHACPRTAHVAGRATNPPERTMGATEQGGDKRAGTLDTAAVAGAVAGRRTRCASGVDCPA